jgi:hypothetical protein
MEDTSDRKRRPRRMNSAPSWMPFRRDPEKDRFYLLAGMGGKALRQKNRRFLMFATVIGLIVAGLVGYAIYRANVRW